jgi:hypothetical protein
LTTYGAITIPVTAPTDPSTEATGDPALDVWAAYLKAYINAYGEAAWAKAFPRSNDAGQVPPVKTTFTHQPTDETIAPFNEKYLPALYVYRASGAANSWEATDWRVSMDTITLLWIFPTGTQPAERIRVPYVNAITKLIDAAIESDRDPVYVHPNDTDPTAASLVADPNAVKLILASSTTAQSYSGAALDGAVGDSAFVQPRKATITIDGDSAAFVDGSVVTVTGKNVLGVDFTDTITISTATFPATLSTTYSFLQVTQIDVDAQADVTGTIEFGLSAYQGRGSMVLNFAPCGIKRAGNWTAKPITIPIQGANGVTVQRSYDAVECPLETYEPWVRDASTLNGLSGTVSANGAGFVQQMQIPT